MEPMMLLIPRDSFIVSTTCPFRWDSLITLVEQELLTLPEHLSSPPGFSWGSCYSIFSFICMFCRSLFVRLYFFFWPLCCLFFFDIRILIAPLVSSNSSFICCNSNEQYEVLVQQWNETSKEISWYRSTPKILPNLR